MIDAICWIICVMLLGAAVYHATVFTCETTLSF